MQAIHQSSYRKVRTTYYVDLSCFFYLCFSPLWTTGAGSLASRESEINTLPQKTKTKELLLQITNCNKQQKTTKYTCCKSPHCSRSVSTPPDLQSSLRTGQRRCSSPTSARSPRCRTSHRRLPCKDMEDKNGVILCKWSDALLHQEHDELLSPGYNTVLKRWVCPFS